MSKMKVEEETTRNRILSHELPTSIFPMDILHLLDAQIGACTSIHAPISHGSSRASDQ
jgi:hypothetical protein